MLKDMMSDYLSSVFGDRGEGRGLMFYRCCWTYPGGVKLLYGVSVDAPETFAVVIPGGALSAMTADERMEVLRGCLRFPIKITRLDVAVDLEGKGVGLIDAVAATCERGELVHARRWEVRQPRAGRKVLGYSVYLGRRGMRNGSGRMVRVYDKGLETASKPRGEWERWEAEFSGPVAGKVAQTLADEGEGWLEAALSMALGAVDFRLVTGHRSLERRPRCEWWREVLASVAGDGCRPVRVKSEAKEARLDAVSGWLRKAVAPTLRRLAVVGQCSLWDVWWDLVGELPYEFQDEEAFLRPVCWQYMKRLERRAAARVVGVPF